MVANIVSNWVGRRIRDRIDIKSGAIVKYNEKNQIVVILFDDGEKRTIPHFRDFKSNQPHGVFYTNRYWDIK